MKINQRLIFLIILLITLNSCKKDEPKIQIQYSYINETLKDSLTFTLGSYWIYQDQNTNIDSIVLSNVESGFTSGCQSTCKQHEFIKLTYENITQGLTFNHYILSNFIRYNGGGQWGQEGQPIYILDANEGHKFNGLVVGVKSDSLTILNEVYYEVQKMTIQSEEQFQDEFEFNTDLYFSPKVGIIKTIIHDTLNGTKTWELIRYNIE